MTTKFSNRNQIQADTLDAYGSLSSPNWSFSEKRYANHPYFRLINQLRNLGDIEETTDLNDDVSIVIFLDLSGSGGFTIRLSLVGRYACISDSAGRFFSRNELREDGQTRRVVDLLQNENVILIEPGELAESLNFGDGEATVYEVLFSADEAIG